MGARPLTPRVHYEEIREPEPGRAERYALRIARLEVPPGDAWAPPAVVRVETNGDGDGEASQQARVEERPAPHRVLGRTDMVDRATWLARALEPPLLVTPLEGQSVVISQTRDYVYPVRFEASDAGLLHRTLSTESLGMKVELKVHAVGEPAGAPGGGVGLLGESGERLRESGLPAMVASDHARIGLGTPRARQG